MTRFLMGLTADTAAEGVIAASKLYDVHPLFIFKDAHGAGRCRQCVGAALIAMLPRRGQRDGAIGVVSRLLGTPATGLAPSGLARANIQPKDLLTVAEAMKAAGLDPQALRIVAQSGAGAQA